VSMLPLYRLAKTTKVYGGRPAVRIDSLDIEKGEILGLVGPTGAGKSTLLRLLGALERPDSGDLWMANHPLHERAPALEMQRKISLVFQRPLLLSGTVQANVEYGLRLRGRPIASQLVSQTLDLLKLTDLARRQARSLSGGEMQMVALARALVLEPEVLLLDEPTNNLDPARVALVEGAVATLQRQLGTTVIWATHNLFQAKRRATRVALLLDGQLVEVACTPEFFETPHDPRTARFISGEMVY
jgi:tungstate transport system ATP-binding protein